MMTPVRATHDGIDLTFDQAATQLASPTAATPMMSPNRPPHVDHDAVPHVGDVQPARLRRGFQRTWTMRWLGGSASHSMETMDVFSSGCYKRRRCGEISPTVSRNLGSQDTWSLPTAMAHDDDDDENEDEDDRVCEEWMEGGEEEEPEYDEVIVIDD